jgi:hypothetical protein
MRGIESLDTFDTIRLLTLPGETFLFEKKLLDLLPFQFKDLTFEIRCFECKDKLFNSNNELPWNSVTADEKIADIDNVRVIYHKSYLHSNMFPNFAWLDFCCQPSVETDKTLREISEHQYDCLKQLYVTHQVRYEAGWDAGRAYNRVKSSVNPHVMNSCFYWSYGKMFTCGYNFDDRVALAEIQEVCNKPFNTVSKKKPKSNTDKPLATLNRVICDLIMSGTNNDYIANHIYDIYGVDITTQKIAGQRAKLTRQKNK